MANKNKVEFGIKNLHVGTYTAADDGTVTLGTPYHQKGAVSYNLEPKGNSSTFYADNTAYFTDYIDNGDEGDLVVAHYDDTFKTSFLSYQESATGGLARIKGATKPAVYIAFEADGDVHSRRMIIYNVSLGSITREHNTTEDTRTPDTESLNTTVSGDNATGIVSVVYSPDDEGYSTLFTSPPVPAVKESTEETA